MTENWDRLRKCIEEIGWKRGADRKCDAYWDLVYEGLLNWRSLLFLADDHFNLITLNV